MRFLLINKILSKKLNNLDIIGDGVYEEYVSLLILLGSL